MVIKYLENIITKTAVFNLPSLKQNSMKIEYSDIGDINSICMETKLPLPFAASEVFKAGISNWERLTAEGDCKAIYEVTFDVEGSNFQFKAGDTIGVIPHNDESDVNQIIDHLELAATADALYALSIEPNQKAKIPVHVPIQSTLRHVLTHCLDLRSVLKKHFLLSLSKYTKDEKEKRILQYLCSKEGSNAYTTFILNKNLCLLDLFSIFSTCKPPAEVLLENLPRLLPRPYSIVNSGLKNNNIIKICFSVLTINNRKGLTTGHLEKLILNQGGLIKQFNNLSISKNLKDIEAVPIYLRKSINQFSLPENMESPLLLIGPGTGVAPFIGFLEERMHHKAAGAKLGETWLFSGCRDPKLDFIYRDNLYKFVDKGILSKLKVAFSRIENSEAKYIQDSLEQNGGDIAQLIKNGVIVFVCGDLRTMVTQIKEVLSKCLVEHEGMTLEEAKKLLNYLQRDKRFIVDAWS